MRDAISQPQRDPDSDREEANGVSQNSDQCEVLDRYHRRHQGEGEAPVRGVASVRRGGRIAHLLGVPHHHHDQAGHKGREERKGDEGEKAKSPGQSTRWLHHDRHHSGLGVVTGRRGSVASRRIAGGSRPVAGRCGSVGDGRRRQVGLLLRRSCPRGLGIGTRGRGRGRWRWRLGLALCVLHGLRKLRAHRLEVHPAWPVPGPSRLV